MAVIGLAGTVVGGILGLLAPWVHDIAAQRRETREEARRRNQSREELIAAWRSVVQEGYNFIRIHETNSVYDFLLGHANFHSLEAHSGESFRLGITIQPALTVGHHLPEPLERMVQAIDALEQEWGLRG